MRSSCKVSGLALTAACWSALGGGVAVAQDPAADQSEETIVVTGTRIPRPDRSAGSPIVTVTRETIEEHGVLELEDFLNVLPQVSPDFTRTANNPGDGTAHVNLRSLGSARTLVLLNGRRLASPTTGGAVDLNQIPEAALQRVDIVTGGTSAVYGSDAIAGVVNFVTRRDFEGAEVGWQGDVFGGGDGRVSDERFRFIPRPCENSVATRERMIWATRTSCTSCRQPLDQRLHADDRHHPLQIVG